MKKICLSLLRPLNRKIYISVFFCEKKADRMYYRDVVRKENKMKIPKEMRQTYDTISKILIDYSAEYLNREYEELCLHALEKLCRKRPSPLKSGKSNTWAAGIVYAIGSPGVLL